VPPFPIDIAKIAARDKTPGHNMESHAKPTLTLSVAFVIVSMWSLLAASATTTSTAIGVTTTSVTLIGEGAPTLKSLFVALGTGYQYTRDDVGLTYVSASTYEQVMNDYDVGQADFIATHSFAAAGARRGSMFFSPVAATALVAVHSALPCTGHAGPLVASCDLIGLLWSGSVTSWSDPRVAALNPACASSSSSNVTLALPLTVGIDGAQDAFVRALADCSGTFAVALAAAGGNASLLPPAADGRLLYVSGSSASSWLASGAAPAGTLSFAALWQTTGVLATAANITAPAYVATMVDTTGAIVVPGATTVTAALTAASAAFNNGSMSDPMSPTAGAVTGVATTAGAWPLCALAWVGLYANGTGRGSVQAAGGADCSYPQELLNMLAWLQVNAAVGTSALKPAGYVPLPFAWSYAAVNALSAVECGGAPVLSQTYIVALGTPNAQTYQRISLPYSAGNYHLKFISSLTAAQAISGMLSGQVDLASTTTLPTAAQMEQMPDVVVLPVEFGAIGPVYSVPELVGRTPLYFDWSVMTGIFIGEIVLWNDSRIAALNPTLAQYLPGKPIVIPYQVLPSAIAAQFTLALSTMNATFAAEVGITWLVNYPVMRTDPARTVAVTGPVVPATMQANPYSFALWPTMSLQGSLGVLVGGIYNAVGNRVIPDTTALLETLYDFAPAMANASASLPEVVPVLSRSPGAWPIGQYNYLMLRTRSMVDAGKAKAIADWLYWVMSAPEAQATAEQNYIVMCGVSPIMMQRALATIVNITVNGVHVSSLYGCVGPDGSLCSNHGTCISSACVCSQPWTGTYCAVDGTQTASTDSAVGVIVPAVVVPVVFVLLALALVVIVVVVWVAIRARRRLADDWEIDPKELEMGDQLGAGGYGTVHKASWKGTEVAVKFMLADATHQEFERFRDEVRIMTALRHPNVVLFMAACTKPPAPCIVMEFMALGSMYDLLRNELIPDLPGPLRIRLAYQAAKGMHFLHSSKVFHRDLKSMNLLLDAKWNVKVSDFGLTRLGTDASPNSSGGKRRNEIIEGTVQWLAPEALASDPDIDPIYVDVYAFGVVLWELLTRDQPYAGLNQAAVAVSVLRDGARPPMPLPGTKLEPLYADYERLVTDCWNQDVVVRPDFLEIMTRLGKLIDVDASSTGGTHTRGGTSSSSASSMTSTNAPMRADHNSSNSNSQVTPIMGASSVPTRKRAPPLPDDGRPLTVVFTDVYRAGALWDSVPPNAIKDAMERHNALVRATATQYGGHESRLPDKAHSGEGTFCLVFATVPAALDFCRAAQRALMAVDWSNDLLEHGDACEEIGVGDRDIPFFRGLRVRMGVHVGQVRGTEDALTRRFNYDGPAVRTAVALTCVAQGGRVLVSNDVRRAVLSSSANAIEGAGDDGSKGKESDTREGAPAAPSYDFVDLSPAAVAVTLPGGRRVRVDACELRTVDGRHFGRRHLGHDVDPEALDATRSTDGNSATENDDHGDDASPMGWGTRTTDAGAADTMLSAANMCRNVIDPKQIEMGEQIGIGAYGVVHRGRWRGVDVAVKRFLHQKQDEAQRIDFRAEVAVLSEARHPNVVLFIGACMRAPDVCIVTEWVSDGNLRDLLAQPSVKITWSAKLGIVRGIALGLDYLHSTEPEAVMHRDLKPSNVLMSPNKVKGLWTPKLADFGLSRTKRDMATMTRCGTPAWTAPEIIRGQDYSEKADIYALGIVMWEVLTRRRPYADANFMSISLDVLEGKRPEVPPDCPSAYGSLMARCWHRKPHKRPTAADVAAQLLSMEGVVPV